MDEEKELGEYKPIKRIFILRFSAMFVVSQALL